MNPWPCDCKQTNLPCGYHEAEHEYSDNCTCGHTLECCRAFRESEFEQKESEVKMLQAAIVGWRITNDQLESENTLLRECIKEMFKAKNAHEREEVLKKAGISE